MKKVLKKLFIVFMVLSMVMGMASITALADGGGEEPLPVTDGSDVYNYSVEPDGTAVLTGLVGECPETLYIPISIANHKVTRVEGFREEENLKYLFVDGVNIGKGAFSECENLKEVYIGHNNGDEIPYITVGSGAFNNSGNGMILNIDFSCYQGMMTIEEYAFSGADISAINFDICEEGLAELNIYNYAFSNCKGLTEVNLPDCAEVRGGAFCGCVNLVKINSTKSVDGVLFDENGKDLLCYPAGKEATQYTIPDKVVAIYKYAFGKANYLQTITIPLGITSIDENAFSGSGITNVIYEGSCVDRNKISIGKGNEVLTNAWKVKHTLEYHGYKRNTCDEAGNYEYWYCTKCGKYFKDQAGTTEISGNDTIIPARGHYFQQRFSYVFSGDYKQITVEQNCANVNCKYKITNTYDTYFVTKEYPNYIKTGKGYYCADFKILYGTYPSGYSYISTSACSKEITIPVKLLPYKDVKDTNLWYYGDVAFVTQYGLMTGLTSEKFGPGDVFARAQFATVLWRMADTPNASYTNKFPDVPDKQWYTTPIMWAYKNGIITGYQNGYFGRDDGITREQFAVMLYRYHKDYKKMAVKNSTNLEKFTDKNNVSSWAVDAMKWAVGNGIITGKDGGKRLAPTESTARCEAAAMIRRYINKYGK